MSYLNFQTFESCSRVVDLEKKKTTGIIQWTVRNIISIEILGAKFISSPSCLFLDRFKSFQS